MPSRREVLQAGLALVIVAGCAAPFDEAAFRVLSETLTGHHELDGDVLLTWFDVVTQRFGAERVAALAAAVHGAPDAIEAARRVPPELAEVAEAIVLAWYTGAVPTGGQGAIVRTDAMLAWACVPYAHRAGIPGGTWAERPA